MQDQHATQHQGSLAQQGFRFVRRASTCTWVHPLEVKPADQDCTDMTDAEFERVAAQMEAQALAADGARNATKATPAHFAFSDHFALEQQNRGAL